MMNWDEGDVMSAFEAVPVIEDEDGVEVSFTTEVAPIRVRLTVWPYHSQIAVTLYGGEVAVFESGIVECDRLVRHRSPEGAEELDVRSEGRSVLVIKLRPWIQVAIRSHRVWYKA